MDQIVEDGEGPLPPTPTLQLDGTPRTNRGTLKLPAYSIAELRQTTAEIYKGVDGLYDSARLQGNDVVVPAESRRTSTSFFDQAAIDRLRDGLLNDTDVKWGPLEDIGSIVSGKQSGVAILTSGGDAPGMNAAVRSCVAVFLAKQARVFAITNGYRGLVEGGSNIKEMTWVQISDIMDKGGTVIGSARCAEMQTREGRLSAACNLAHLGINRLIVIGGDGSLTGAEVFKTEWPNLLKELVVAGRLEAELANKLGYLCIVGMVGSIDNDMCGFSSTIGADTALNRICDACDALITTAQSHQRTFIVEVMGRNCGWLALNAAIAVGADWVFIPEVPPVAEDWETELCNTLEARRKHSKYAIVIVAEGATDRVRRPIEAEYLRSVLSQRLGHDTRVTRLGHVQRGGSPSAYDRIQGTRVGAEAALALLEADDLTPSRIVGLRYRRVIQLELTAAVNVTKKLGKVLSERRYDEALEMRTSTFKNCLDLYQRTREWNGCEQTGFKVCILHAGSPAGGKNAVTKILVRKLINLGHIVYGVSQGFQGLAQGLIQELHWEDVAQWSGEGGCNLGTNRTLPQAIGLDKIALKLNELGINGMIVCGGFEAYLGMLKLREARSEYTAFRIPMSLVPITISNNIPGTDISVGVDTALNAIVEAVDTLKISAASSRARLFLVEVMGSRCGFLATFGALAGGADNAYCRENHMAIDDIEEDIEYLRKKFAAGFKKGLIIRNENCSQMYDMGFMQAAFEQEGTRKGKAGFTVRNLVLGHLQQGNRPSPLDRVRAARMASGAVDFVIEQLKTGPRNDEGGFESDESVCVCGLVEEGVDPRPVVDLIAGTDFANRRPKDQWFVRLQSLVRLLEMNSTDRWGDDCEYKPYAKVLSNDEILPGLDSSLYV